MRIFVQMLAVASLAALTVGTSALSADAQGYCRRVTTTVCDPPVVRRATPPPVVRYRAPRVHSHYAPPAPRFDSRGHDTTWMQRQGFTSCTQVYTSCLRGANKPGHGLAYAGVCENRLATCRRTGTWATTHTGTVHGLRP